MGDIKNKNELFESRFFTSNIAEAFKSRVDSQFNPNNSINDSLYLKLDVNPSEGILDNLDLKNPNSIRESSTKDMLRPEHYGGKDNIYEVFKVIEAWGLDKDAYLFNVIKYVARAGKKNKDKELEDLEKAEVYLKRKIDNIKKGMDS